MDSLGTQYWYVNDCSLPSETLPVVKKACGETAFSTLKKIKTFLSSHQTLPPKDLIELTRRAIQIKDRFGEKVKGLICIKRFFCFICISYNEIKVARVFNEILQKRYYAEQKTILHMAAGGGQAHVVKALVENGVRIEARDRHGYTALHLAAMFGQVEAVGVLLENGAQIETKDGFGFTALHLAVRCGLVKVVEFLLGKGANIKAKDHCNRTALDIALEKNDQELIALLTPKPKP